MYSPLPASPAGHPCLATSWRCLVPTFCAPMQVVAIARSSSTTIGGARARAVGTAPVSRKDAKRPRARRYLSPRPATPNKGTWNAESSTWHTRKQGKDTSRIGGERRVHWRYGKAMKTLLGAACPGHPLPFLHLNLQGGTLS